MSISKYSWSIFIALTEVVTAGLLALAVVLGATAEGEGAGAELGAGELLPSLPSLPEFGSVVDPLGFPPAAAPDGPPELEGISSLGSATIGSALLSIPFRPIKFSCLPISTFSFATTSPPDEALRKRRILLNCI